jgi:hypothetical protein
MHAARRRLHDQLIELSKLAADSSVSDMEVDLALDRLVEGHHAERDVERRRANKELYEAEAIALRGRWFGRALSLMGDPARAPLRTPKECLARAYKDLKRLGDLGDVWFGRETEKLRLGDRVPCDYGLIEDDFRCWYETHPGRLNEFDGVVYVSLLAGYGGPGYCDVCHDGSRRDLYDSVALEGHAGLFQEWLDEQPAELMDGRARAVYNRWWPLETSPPRPDPPRPPVPMVADYDALPAALSG